VWVWDAETGKEVLQVKQTGGVLGLTWGPDSRRLASASPDATVTLWKLAD
jgi:WD40 repeat protein